MTGDILDFGFKFNLCALLAVLGLALPLALQSRVSAKRRQSQQRHLRRTLYFALTVCLCG
jgi:hypothetical protein